MFPEATISQSFTLKSFKSGAARMAQEAGVPLIPMAVWGTQRLWTKGHPRNFKRSHTPITIRVGEAIEASGQVRGRDHPSAARARAGVAGGGAAGVSGAAEEPGRHLVDAGPPRRHGAHPEQVREAEAR
ncbi:hypothetical protein SALBM217S_01655 [Streptomyces griseoloalbus]